MVDDNFGAGSRRINLMFYISGLHPGGAERVVANLCGNLDPARYAITVCWRNECGSIGEEIRNLGITVTGLPEIDPRASPYCYFLVLRRLLRELRIDVVHTHDSGSLADAAQCRLLGARAKIVHTFHFGNYPNLKRSYLWMERIFGRIADRLVAVGFEQAKSIRKSLRLGKRDLSVLYNGVEPVVGNRVGQRNIVFPDISNEDIVIGSISTLTTQKGLFVLLDAVEHLREHGVKCKVVIAGGGPLRTELQHFVQERKLQSVVYFLGWVDKAADALLPALDIFCQSSLWEANSIVLLEAMAAGLPIVTTNVGESRHVIEHGRTGLIVETGNALEMAKALARLVSSAPERVELGRHAKAAYAERFTVEEMVRNYETVYEDLNCYS